MAKTKKPWLNFKGDGPERVFEYPKKTQRNYKHALLWLVVFGYLGAHRFYLWNYKKAQLTIFIYFTVIILSVAIERLPQNSISLLFWLLVIIFELPKLRYRVAIANAKHGLE